MATGSIFGVDPDAIDLDYVISDQGKNLSGGQKASRHASKSNGI